MNERNANQIACYKYFQFIAIQSYNDRNGKFNMRAGNMVQRANTPDLIPGTI